MKAPLIVFVLFFSQALLAVEFDYSTFIKRCGWGTVWGAGLGLVSLAFENHPYDHFNNVTKGASLGLYGGMIYGMTNRLPWSDDADPRPIWKIWDDFGIKGSQMIGYWTDNCPVKTSNDKVLATVYKKNAAVLISIASCISANAITGSSLINAALAA